MRILPLVGAIAGVAASYFEYTLSGLTWELGIFAVATVLLLYATFKKPKPAY